MVVVVGSVMTALMVAPPAAYAEVTVSAGNPKLSVVVTGNDYQVYRKTYVVGGSWSDWKPEGRPSVGLQGGPAIVYRTPDTFIIFVRGGDNALWYKVKGGSWYSIGKPNGVDLASDPDATSWGDGWAEVFVTAANGLVYNAGFAQGVNPVWRGSIGSPFGNATSGPSAVSWYDSSGVNQRVFVRDQNGALRSLPYSGSGWYQGDWANHGGYIDIGTSPDATAWDYLHMDAFVIGGDKLLYEKTFAGSWGDWHWLNGGVIGSPGAAALNGQIDLFVRRADNALYHKTCRPRSGETVTCQDENGSQWNHLAGGLKSDPDADWT